jgi:hypothetical protein
MIQYPPTYVNNDSMQRSLIVDNNLVKVHILVLKEVLRTARESQNIHSRGGILMLVSY